jgi:hypothetical protein
LFAVFVLVCVCVCVFLCVVVVVGAFVVVAADVGRSSVPQTLVVADAVPRLRSARGPAMADEEKEERGFVVWLVLAFALLGFYVALRHLCRWMRQLCRWIAYCRRRRPICWMQPIRPKGGGTASQKGQRLSQIMKEKT